MTEESQLVEYLRKVTTDLQRTRSQLREAETRGTEPIAIVGMGCRYPGGVRSAEDLWRLVAEGRDEISEFPTDRGWDVANLYDADPAAKGKSYTREGGFLDGIELFDAEFFGLSPREALSMDPQQRLLLETTWEALEDAGIRPETLRGSRTGVFTGVMHHDYGSRFHEAPDGFEGYLHTGSAGSMAVGRVSYLYGLEGPAVTVDTACSSSLVALHQAVSALRGGECDLALAGGVAVMATPNFFVEYSRMRVLSTDGRCHSFADDGDGTGWSEGVGVLAVERLSDARRLGHRVLAVVRGSAVNQDGASNGMTAPSGPAQQRVIEAALRHARLSADGVDVVEAHGTGTRLGDPIEAQALIATYGKAHSAGDPLYLGSLKSNIGHTQAAAGVAGVIKMVQAMRHGVLPRSLYADNPTTEVDWSARTVELLAESRPWERGDRPRRAAVSSFGMSGTNAHVILEEYVPEPAVAPASPSGITPLIVSGKTAEAARAQAQTLREHLLAHPEQPLADVAGTLAHRRSLFPHRIVAGGDRAGIVDGLTTTAPAVALPGGRIAAVFSGQGAQHPGMGRQLAADFPVFAAAFAEVCAVVDPLLGRPLREVIDSEAVNRTEYAQPALFAFEVALARLWQSWGLTFTAVAGHSVGEIAAAVIAGVLRLEDAARLAVTRGRLMGALPAGGAMAAINAPAAEVTIGGDVAVAAVNGPDSVVVSGPEADVDRVVADWRSRGHRAARLRVSHAFHSALIEPMLAAFGAELATITFHEPAITISASADTAHPITTAAYWLDHARKAVLFAHAVAGLPTVDALLEIGPDAALTPMLDDAIPSSRRDRDETRTLLAAATTLPIDWAAVVPAGRPVALPHHAFQHQRYWLDQPAGHPFLTGSVELPDDGGLILTGRISPSTDPWLDGHAVSGTVLLPGTGFLELALLAARRTGAGQVSDLVVQAPLVLSPTGVDIQVSVAADRGLTIRSRDEDGGWHVHATGSLAEPAEAPAGTDWAIAWPPPGATAVDVAALYDDLDSRGYAYGPVFRGLRAAWQDGHDLYAEVALAEADQDRRFGLHPALLDAALHALALTGDSTEVRLPFAFNRSTMHSSSAADVRVRLRTTAGAARLDVASPTGDAVLTVDELVLRAVDPTTLAARAGAQVDRWRHEVTWERLPDATAGPLAGTWLVLAPAEVPWIPALLESRTTDLAATPVGVLCFPTGPEDLLTTVRSLTEAGVAAPIWCVTHDCETDPDAAAIWGAGRAAALELPGRWGGLVDLPAPPDATAIGRLAALLADSAGEDQIRITPAGAYARRLVKAAPVRDLPPWSPSGTVLITGGTGALGGSVARWLAGLGGASLVLISRRGPQAPGASELLAELTAAGTPARIVAADAADRAAMTQLVREAADAGVPVRGVFHAAGVAAESPMLRTDPDRFRAVLDGKLEGARVLDAVLGDSELDAFVLFSSVSGIWGAAGQSAYGAGNAGLHALAAARRARGLAGTALAWGPWAGGGMVDADREPRLRRQGLVPLPTADAITALARSVALGTDSVLAEVAWSRFLPLFTASRPAPLFAAFAPRPVGTAAATPAVRTESMVDLVRAEIAAAVGHADATRIAADRPLRELGFDSLMSVQLRNRLSAATGVKLPATLVFDYPTAAALAAHLEASGRAAPAAAAATATATGDDPIAIVGMACRYPGDVTSPDDLWRLVAEGRDAVTEFPADRGWDLAGLYDPDQNRTGHTYTKEGGFLADPAGFDAAFFDIPPREALAMDPQQRLLLETSWSAIEHAGITPASLRGSRTGVFAGVMYNDYYTRLDGIPDGLEGILGLANSNSVMSGRISYLLGLEGPAITVDTACSTSLVTLHLAGQALRAGECDLALAGGATVMASPNIFIEFARQGGLSPDGRSKSFSAGADGTGWSEGAGMLVLERLSDARRLGHEVLAVVRGSAVNQDGASNGMTAPNGPSQQRVIRAALDRAGLTAGQVDAVEAHGTGTRLGDPIEAQALIATYGDAHSPAGPLYLGSLKSNIGHTQAAAGVAGIIKMTQALRHETLPPTLHAAVPSPEVDWSAGTVELLTTGRAWPRGSHPRRAGVSSFGISGTNAHVILEEGDPIRVPPPRPVTTPLLFPLSARTPGGVRAQALALRDHLLAHPELPLADVAWSLANTRSAFPHRSSVVAADRAEVLSALTAVTPGVAGPGRVAAVFSGQGAQHPGMGRKLAADFPVFAAALAEVGAVVDPLLGRPLRDVMDSELVNRTEYAQPALFAFEVALARLWQSWGVTFTALAGHSVGEIAAAVVAGVLTLPDAARLVVARGRLMGALPAGGAMAAVNAAAADVKTGGDVVIAAVNGPQSVVVSGPEADVERIVAEFKARGRPATRLRVSHAFHSPLMEPMLAAFRAELDGLTFHQPRIPISTSADTEHPIDGAAYWVDHVRRAVLFADAVGGLPAVDVLLEIGPDAALTPMLDEAVASSRRDRDETRTVLAAAGALVGRGVVIDWSALLPVGARVPLPTYAFQHERFWIDGAVVPATVDRYEVTWDEIPPATGTIEGDWVVVMHEGQDEPEILDALKNSRAHLHVMTAGTEIPTGTTGIISLLALDAAEHPDHPGTSTGALATLSLIQAQRDSRLWTLTRGAETDAWQAQTWGLGRVAALEHPTTWGGLIDLDGDFSPPALHVALTNTAGEDQIRIVGDRVQGRRLSRTTAPATGPWWTGGTTLITGGTGALGAHTARWLTTHGAPKLILTSRQGPDAPGAAELRTELGDTVSIIACDITDRGQVARLVADHPDIRAVVHAAGTTTEQALADLDPASYAATTAAKVAGAELLDELLPGDLDAFVVYSSIAGTWGSAHSGAYAAANAHLDALIRRRRTGTSIAWGPWAGGGLADPEFRRHLRERGIRALPPRQAVETLRYADPAAATVSDMDWDRFADVFTAQRPSPLLKHLVSTREEPGSERSALARRVAGLGSDERHGVVLELVCAEVASVLGHESARDVDPYRAFQELRFDSMMSVDLRTRLNRATGLRLPATLVFDHPTPEAVTEFLCQEITPGRDELTGLVLANFDQLESTLLALDPGDGTRTRFTARLGALLAKLDRPAGDAAPAGGTTTLATASAAELLKLIDQDLD
ncbi:type I polyketide synthase [Paractinoplanes ferrugineus]|uniref:Acyl transferase domain-containing protein n=1 Tax=Paractinoplanes ferrugineus TaxID=113564 RepID=A0A919MM06_9ACTN|nr:type I polyketide synthase [Actinoplanes ferrugineus]GIE12752.1 hypothetical protein Afe05nite_45920 [Actinoplanes ferrugineus]